MCADELLTPDEPEPTLPVFQMSSETWWWRAFDHDGEFGPYETEALALDALLKAGAARLEALRSSLLTPEPQLDHVNRSADGDALDSVAPAPARPEQKPPFPKTAVGLDNREAGSIPAGSHQPAALAEPEPEKAQRRGVTGDKPAGSNEADLKGPAGKPSAVEQTVGTFVQTEDAGEGPAPDSITDAELLTLRQERDQWESIACMFHDALAGKGMAGRFNHQLCQDAVQCFDALRRDRLVPPAPDRGDVR
jgi:hypothetical protein